MKEGTRGVAQRRMELAQHAVLGQAVFSIGVPQGRLAVSRPLKRTGDCHLTPTQDFVLG